MMRWNVLAKPSIYRQILASFAVIVVLILVAGIFNSYELTQLQRVSQQVAPVGEQLITVQEYALTLESLDVRLEQFILVGDEATRNEIELAFEQLQSSIVLLQEGTGESLSGDVQQLEAATNDLIAESQLLIATLDEQNTSVNLLIRNVFTSIDDSRSLSQDLTTELLTLVQTTVTEQARFVEQISVQLYVLTGIIFMIGVGSAVYVSRRVAGPLAEMAAIATEVAEGNLEARVRVKSEDETGRLGLAFNRMADQVEQTLNDLKKANRELKEVSRLKDEFLAIMSHELRTPLNAIIGFHGIMLMDDELNEESQFMVKRSRANADRLLNLINDILDISRIESGRLQLVPVELHIAELAEHWEAQMSILATEKNLDFEVVIDESLPDIVYADEDAVTKIVTNLLGNAFKFTEQGKVLLKMGSAEGKWVIEVSDTGEGIPAHMQEIIFERFRQVDGSSTRKFGGSGLGLAIVRNLCLAMNGTVTVTSTPGSGSNFTVSLPVEMRERTGVLTA